VQLHLSRGQATKLFGGVRFELHARATITEEEAELIGRYKVQDEVLADKELKIPLTGKSIFLKVTIGSLVSGQTFKCNDIREILNYEQEIKSSCATLRQMIEVMKTFGGEEVIDITGVGAQTISAKA
jgi:hypothetical protein